MYVRQRCPRTAFIAGFHSRGGKRIVANSRGSKPIINIGKPIAKGGGGEAPPGPPEMNPACIYTVLFMYMYGVLTYHIARNFCQEKLFRHLPSLAKLYPTNILSMIRRYGDLYHIGKCLFNLILFSWAW